MSTNDLQSLLVAAQLACDEGDSTRDFEPAFTKVLDFIQRNPSCRAEAVTELIKALHRTNGLPWELLTFLMHELRWPEVRKEAMVVIQRTDDWRMKTPLSHVVASFEEDWPDSDMYERWRSP